MNPHPFATLNHLHLPLLFPKELPGFVEELPLLVVDVDPAFPSVPVVDSVIN